MNRHRLLTFLVPALPGVLAAIVAFVVVGYVAELNEQLAAAQAALKSCRDAGQVHR